MSLIFLSFTIGTTIGEDVPRKFPTLTSLMNCVLILSRGNAEPESGFSVKKFLWNIHGLTTSEETSEALRFGKDCFNRKGGVESMKVSKGLTKVCQNAHSLYTLELPERRKQELEVKEATIRIQKQEKEQTLAMIKSGIEITENSIKDGNSDLESLLTQVTFDRYAIAKAQQKISISVKRKSELEVSSGGSKKKQILM